MEDEKEIEHLFQDQADRLYYLRAAKFDLNNDFLSIHCELAESGSCIQEILMILDEISGGDMPVCPLLNELEASSAPERPEFRGTLENLDALILNVARRKGVVGGKIEPQIAGGIPRYLASSAGDRGCG